jgi:thymidylate synthase (FAD)
MNKIEVKILNPEVVSDAEKMMVFCARLTQRGHGIHNMNDLTELLEAPYQPKTMEAMTKLPHPTIQKFGVINVAVVGASRRFLAQTTRHQNEVKFMSASLQYSDYSGQADFCVPYDIIKHGPVSVDIYNSVCHEAMEHYECAIESGIDNDAAGYMAPPGLRNILIISATPYQWKHMISQRICRRNTAETRYVMLLIWKELAKLSDMFKDCGPFCTDKHMRGCPEGKMTCGKPIDSDWGPEDILKSDFPEVYDLCDA